MRWPVLGHVTGINSATTTCQPRPANHDLCVSLAVELIRKRSLMPQYASKWRDYKVFLYGNSYFINILDKKTIQNLNNCKFYDISLSSVSIQLRDTRPVVTSQWLVGVAKQSGHVTQCLQWLCSLNLGSWEAVWLDKDSQFKVNFVVPW